RTTIRGLRITCRGGPTKTPSAARGRRTWSTSSKRSARLADDEPGQQLATAGHAVVPVELLDVLVHGVEAQPGPVRDAFGRLAGEQAVEHRAQALRQVALGPDAAGSVPSERPPRRLVE